MLDRFSFWFSSRNSFQGAESIVMQTFIVFGPNFIGGGGGEGAEVSEGNPCRRKPDFRQYYVIIKFCE